MLIQCKESNKSDILIGQWSKKLRDSQSNASLGCCNRIWKFASETMADILSRFSLTTAAEKQLKQWKHCKKHCFLVVSLEKVVFWEGNYPRKSKITNQPSLTLCSNDPTPKLKTNMVKLQTWWFHFIESDWDTDWTIPGTV